MIATLPHRLYQSWRSAKFRSQMQTTSTFLRMESVLVRIEGDARATAEIFLTRDVTRLWRTSEAAQSRIELSICSLLAFQFQSK
eukprot:c12603_g1_i1 orf=145-396(-)